MNNNFDNNQYGCHESSDNSSDFKKSVDNFSYRWNYNNYKKTCTPAKKSSKKFNGLKAFAICASGIFVVSFAILTAVITMNMFNNSKQIASGSASASSLSGSGNVAANNTSQFITFPTSGSIHQATAGTLTIPQIAEKCRPGAVGIVVEVETNYGFGFGSYVSTGVGSGFVLTADGYIVTNHHVVNGAKKITVVLYDETEVEATLVGSDALSDLAVLKIEHDNLVPLELGNSDELVVGELAVAIGSPAGIEFHGTVTDGIISAIKRDVEITDSYGRVQKTMTLIQTNATINKGNSGGPLINSKGQVIGINTLKLTNEYEGIGFSIPINGAKPIIEQLVKDGKVSERGEADFVSGGGSIGITQYADISAEEAEYYGIPQGVYVIQIIRDSNAAQAGLRRGDIIVKYNGTAVKTVAEINQLKSKNRAGDKVTLTIYRDQEGEIDITFNLNSQED